MVSLTLQSIEFAKVNVDVQPRNQHYDSESDGSFHSRERNREQNQHLTSNYRRVSQSREGDDVEICRVVDQFYREQYPESIPLCS